MMGSFGVVLATICSSAPELGPKLVVATVALPNPTAQRTISLAEAHFRRWFAALISSVVNTMATEFTYLKIARISMPRIVVKYRMRLCLCQRQQFVIFEVRAGVASGPRP